MKVKVFSMVGVSRYETEDETYNEVGVYGSLLEAQEAMQDSYDEEMGNFDGDLPVDMEAVMGERAASIEYSEHCFSWDIYEHLLDAEPAFGEGLERGILMEYGTTGFNDRGFMEYLSKSFSGFENAFLRNLIENLIGYGLEHERVSKDQFCHWISDLLPEVSFGEVAAFMNDNSLTANGIREKEEAIEKFKLKNAMNG